MEQKKRIFSQKFEFKYIFSFFGKMYKKLEAKKGCVNITGLHLLKNLLI